MSKDGSQDFYSVLESCLVLINEQGFSLEECLERFPQHREKLQRMLPVLLHLGRGRSLTASDELHMAVATRLASLHQASSERSSRFLVTNLAALRSIFQIRNTFAQRRAWMIPALITIMVVAVLSMTGLVASADAAGPGDLLFGLDTAIEDIRLSFVNDEAEEAELRLGFATERLEELKVEIEGEGDQQDIERALLQFEAALAAIEALLGELTPEQRAAFDEALATLIASVPNLSEFEFEFQLQDGEGVLKLEIESGDDLDGDDLDDDEDCDSSGSGSGDCLGDDENLDDDGLDDDDEDCDSSGTGSGDACEDDDDEEACDSSGSGSGEDCDDEEEHDEDEPDEHDEEEEDDEEDEKEDD
jgi:hypothetical protein